jgi:uncharacterized SAM-binding protein YcdF (DUF218 family)
MERQPRTFLISAHASLRHSLARALMDNRLRADHPVLVAQTPPGELPQGTECILVPESLAHIEQAATSPEGIIIATHELAQIAGASRCRTGVAIVLLGHTNPARPGQLTRVAEHRLRLARRLALRHARSLRVVVLSGRGPSGVAAEADQYAQLWEGDRLPLVREVASTDTPGNAREAAQLLEFIDGVERIILVTSWWHAARAARDMRAALVERRMNIAVTSASAMRPLPRIHQLRNELRLRRST